MNKPQDINLGKGWHVRFQDADNPACIEYRKSGKTYGASLGYFENCGGTSGSPDEEFDAPQSVLDNFEYHSETIYAWEDDYYLRNPKEL